MIVLDMDGVLANFNRGVSSAFARPHVEPTRWDYFTDWGLTVDEFWNGIHRWGDAFYTYMVPPYPWKDELLAAVTATDDVVIMSSPSNDPVGYAAKKIWCDKYAPGIKLIVGSEKQLLARRGVLLIDDYDKNIERFLKSGGDVFAFPQPWNINSHAVGNRMGLLKHKLDNWNVTITEPEKVAA